MRTARTTAVALLAVLVGAIGPALAEERPDFSGTWVLDRARSDAPPARGAAGPHEGGVTLVIRHAEPVLTIERRVEGKGPRSRTVTYYTDGRTTESGGPYGSRITSTAAWEGRTLVVHTTRTRRTRGGSEATVEVTTRYDLSDDGRTLTVGVAADTPRGARTRHLVYTRQ